MYVESSLPPVAVIKTDIYTLPCNILYQDTTYSEDLFRHRNNNNMLPEHCLYCLVSGTIWEGMFDLYLCLCIFITGTEDTQHRAAKSQSKQADFSDLSEWPFLLMLLYFTEVLSLPFTIFAKSLQHGIVWFGFF